ncbi:hypothetical protein CLOM621_06962 [Clostridium sp. M62/1]|nr:hypothetical protein CLOM621_06962 [Clostridium sp. M62/1]
MKRIKIGKICVIFHSFTLHSDKITRFCIEKYEIYQIKLW